MSPPIHAELIEKAKRLAAPVASCVHARVCFGHLVGTDTDVKQLLALITVLAEVADERRMAELSKLPGDEGLPSDRDTVLRAAHAHVAHLRRDGRPVPVRIGMLENTYNQRGGKRQRPSRGPGARLAWRRQQQERTEAA